MIVYVDADLEEIIPEFLDNRRRDIKTLTSALDRGDLDTVLSMGHQMKGAGGSYGFDAISDFGGEMETAAKAGDTEAAMEAVRRLERFLAEVEVVYE